MATTTLGIKVDKATQARLQALAKVKDRSPHWVLRKALARQSLEMLAWDDE
jgi:predicted transcriptional regulator